MIFCNKCVLPNTRPEIEIGNDGTCSACKFHNYRYKINWKKREKQFVNLAKKIKKNTNSYDCLIPVSGGKDSTWQVSTCLKYGLKPLTFTYKPILRTKIGKENLENLLKLGVDHIDFTINRKLEIKLLKESFYKYGAVGIPMHMAMWSLSFNLAKMYKIRYIFWGENPAKEYSGTRQNIKIKTLNENWIKKFGISFGRRPENWISKRITKKEMFSLLRDKNYNVKALFLSDYFNWDPIETYKYSKKIGFKKLHKSLTGIYNYADIDDDLISIHHYLKLYKFGFSRSHDNLSLEIRNKRITREKAIKIISKESEKKPVIQIRKFCKLIGISEKKFFKVCERFRNNKIWKKKNNKWHLIVKTI